MNKRIFTSLIALMGISILAIIIIQVVWMNNAIQVKNELFDRSVSEALNSTTSRLENMRDFRMINHFAAADTNDMRNFEPGPPPLQTPYIPGHRPRRIAIPRVPGNPSARQIEMILRATKDKKGMRFQMSSKGDSLNKEKEDIIIINNDSLARNMDSVYARGLERFDSLTRHFEHGQDSTFKIRKRFEIRKKKLTRVADKVVEEISQWEEPELSAAPIQDILAKELKNRN
ncbi:MAG: hypothetical protein ACM3PR_13785, partial [Bacteroidales bacterium]